MAVDIEINGELRDPPPFSPLGGTGTPKSICMARRTSRINHRRPVVFDCLAIVRQMANKLKILAI